jgi:hypothetical protein
MVAKLQVKWELGMTNQRGPEATLWGDGNALYHQCERGLWPDALIKNSSNYTSEIGEYSALMLYDNKIDSI